MKSKLVSILAVLMLLLSALPAGLATAEQGEASLDDTEYTNFTNGGSQNIVTITVEDDDLNVATELTADHELIGVADGSTTTFTTDNANINSVDKVFDLFDGIAYFTAVSEDNTQVTLNTARAAEVNASIAGTVSVTNNIAEGSAATITPTGDVAPAASAGAGASDNKRIYAIQFEVDDTDAGKAANGSGDAGSGNIDNTLTVHVKGDIVNATTGAVTADQTVTMAITADNDAVVDRPLVSGGAPVYFSGPAKYWVQDAAAINTQAETVTIKVNQVRAIAARYNYDVANTTDYTDDDGDTHQSVTITSTTDPDGLELTLTETAVASGEFDIDIALITEAVNDAIENQISASNFSTADNTAHDLENLTDALATTDTTASLAAEDDIDFIASDIAGIDNNTKLDDLLAILLVVSHDDEITVTYDDQGTGEAESEDTATIDAEAPVLSNVSPADGDFTSDETPEFTVTMVDADSGVDLSTLAMTVYKTDDTATNVSDDVSTDPITDGYDMVFIAGATELGADPGDGVGAAGQKHDWKFSVADEVGNIATTDDADNSGGGTPKRIEYTIDTNEPALASAKTGIGLELKEDETDEHVEIADAAWIRVIFDEELDQDSLQTSDFEVDGEEPVAVLFSDDIDTAAGGSLTDDAKYVYLQMAADLDADATPEVEVVDDVDDAAGNDVDEDDVDATDGIAPTLTVTVDVTVGEDEEEVTITVTSDEDLIQSTLNVDVENAQGGAPNASTDITMTKDGTNNTWTGTFEIDDSAAYNTEVNADDEAGNSATENNDADFEGDENATISHIRDSGGNNLDNKADVEEGAVWIVTTFDEDNEYTNDTSDEITITAVSLLDEDDNELAGDVSALMTDDDVVFTLAVTLTPGEYTFEITGEDAVGNETSDTADFEVIEKDPFDLSLQPGVNLVSIPGTPSGDAAALSTLFADTEVSSVITYDAATGANGGNPWLTSTKDAASGDWSGDIASLEPGKSYFVETAASATVEILLEDAGVEVPPSVAVYEGWNAVGYWSISGDTYADLDSYLTSIEWSVAYSYDPTPGEGWKTLRSDAVVADSSADGAGDGNAANGASPSADAGRGYLVYATADGTLTP
tara:strand:+ start:151 stop:3450 length:3300 start_codon:yes stop_codon:yes gene_type:complete